MRMVTESFQAGGIFLFLLAVLRIDVRIGTEDPSRFQSAYLSRSGPGAELLGFSFRAAPTSCAEKGSLSRSTLVARGHAVKGGGVPELSETGYR